MFDALLFELFDVIDDLLLFALSAFSRRA